MTINTRPLALASLLAAALLVSSASAMADTITVTFDSPVQSSTANSVLSFSGTIFAAATNASTVYLNGDFFPTFSSLTNPASPVLDDTAFLNDVNNFVSVDPGKSFSGLFFTVNLPPGIAASVYNGTFQVSGGADPFATDVINTASFQVNINAASPVPEPSAWLLLTTGLTAFAAFGLYKRHSSSLQQ